MNISSARIRPSLEKPIFIRPCKLGRARPMKCLLFAADAHHHRRVGFLDSNAGMIMETPPVILLPNPPPVYSLMKTILSRSMFIHLAMAGRV